MRGEAVVLASLVQSSEVSAAPAYVPNSGVRAENEFISADPKMTESELVAESMPRTGLVVVGYNELPLLRVCLGSLRRLSYPNLQIIYVDNMSSDGTLEALQLEFPEVVAVSSGSNAGYCGGNNVGIRLALQNDCQYILLLNPDTELFNPDFLSILVSHMEAHSDIGKTGPRVFFREEGVVQNTILRFPLIHRRVISWFRHRLFRIPETPCSTLSTPHDSESLNGCCVLVRAEALQSAGGLDEIMWCYSDEVEWDFRLRNAGWRRVFVPVDSIIHHQRLTGYDPTSRASLMQSRNGAYLFRKHGRWLSLLIWIIAKLFLATGRLLTALCRGQSVADHVAYLRRLASAFMAVILGRYTSAAFGFGSEAARNGGSPHAVT